MNRYMRRRPKRPGDRVTITARGRSLLETHDLEQATQHRERLDGALYDHRRNGRPYNRPQRC